MLVLVDTCFFSHAKELHEVTILDIRTILSKFRWGFTPAVREEIMHRRLDDFAGLDEAIIVPVTASERNAMLARSPSTAGLDKADQELITANNREHGLILSDDGELLLECSALGMLALSLPAFLLSLAREGMVEKRTVARCLRSWETSGRFKKQHVARWKHELHDIR